MAARLNKKKKKLVVSFFKYSMHLWLLIFLCNVAIYYAFTFFIRASTDKPQTSSNQTVNNLALTDPTLKAEQTLQPRETITPTPTPAGPILNLSFTLPGISTLGGNLQPMHPIKRASIYLYGGDANTNDISVKPMQTIDIETTFDNDQSSPTYTYFINRGIDLGPGVKEGKYQIALKTPQTLATVIKDPGALSVGGKIYELKKKTKITLPPQSLLSGDIYPYPNPDNHMTIDDYNMLVNCFSNKAGSGKCINSLSADLDDNGVVDGIDYNIMLMSFVSLKARGFPVPSIILEPQIVVNPTTSLPQPIEDGTEKTNVKPTAVPAQSSSSGIVGLLVVFFGLALIGGIGFFLVLRFKLLDKILKKAPSGVTQSAPSEQTAQPTEQAVPEIPAQQDVQESSTQPAQTPAEPGQVPTTAAQSIQTIQKLSKEKEIFQANTTDKTPAPAVPAPTPQTQAAAPADTASNGVVEKSGFLKKVSDDVALGGTWVTIADDSGITRAFTSDKKVADGFVKVKGTMANDAENKQFLQISELAAEG